jgi:hypothetical protein
MSQLMTSVAFKRGDTIFLEREPGDAQLCLKSHRSSESGEKPGRWHVMFTESARFSASDPQCEHPSWAKP